MDINYIVQFHSEWHCGSGLSAGADADLLVIKDKDGLPYLPGKTVKGLVREAVEDIISFMPEQENAMKRVTEIFGCVHEKKDSDDPSVEKGVAFFSNAELSSVEKMPIIVNDASSFLYRSLSRTAIDENGVAKKHSLRKIQVVVPCELEGAILNVPEQDVQLLKDAMKYIKRLGQDRNRGLGRCTFIVK